MLPSLLKVIPNVSSLLPEQTLYLLRVSSRRPRKRSTTTRLVFQIQVYTLLYSDHWARSAQIKLWPDECMKVRPFAGGKWAYDATMDGQQTGRAASHEKPTKKTLVISHEHCQWRWMPSRWIVMRRMMKTPSKTQTLNMHGMILHCRCYRIVVNSWMSVTCLCRVYTASRNRIGIERATKVITICTNTR